MTGTPISLAGGGGAVVELSRAMSTWVVHRKVGLDAGLMNEPVRSDAFRHVLGLDVFGDE